MVGPRTQRRLAFAFIAIAYFVAPVAAQEPLRLGPAAGGDAAPIQFAADDIVTWRDEGEQIFLLRGRVLIEQGILQLRANRAILAVDVEQQKQTDRYAVRISADGDVHIESGTNRRTVPVAIVGLTTKRTVKVRSGNRVVERSEATDEFVKWGRAAQRTEPIRQTAAVSPPAQPGIGVAPAPPRPAPSSPTQNPGGAVPAQPEFPAPSPGTQLPVAPMPSGQNTPVPPATPRTGPAPARSISIAPRRSTAYDTKTEIINGERVSYASGGVIVTIRNVKGIGLIDIEADRLVMWTKSDSGDQLLNQMNAPDGKVTQAAEFYLEGDVQIRSKSAQSDNLLTADRVYYDVNRNVAVAVQADLELRRPDLPDPLHMKAEELLQVSPTRFEAVRAQVYSSRLPSDPGLTLVLAQAIVEDKHVERRGLFGGTSRNPETGEPSMTTERIVKGENVILRIEDVPVFYLPYIQGNANNPLGPLRSVGFKQDRIFGTQVLATFDVWNLLSRDPVPGTKWTLEADYLSRRGPALGTTFEYVGRDLFGMEGVYGGVAKLFGIYDTGTDILGGDRGEFDNHPLTRGRALLRHNQTFLEDWTVNAQLSYLSDKNFFEQYYKTEFDTDPNQETFIYLKRQRDNWNASILAKPNIRNWVTEDVWLPRVDVNLVGQSFFDLFTYNLRANGGYAQLRPTEVPPPPLQPNEVRADLGRFDVNQDIGLPFYLGPVKVVPYGTLDLTQYTSNVNGDAEGRIIGGGGVRASLPFTRVFPEVESQLLNLKGINHKIVFGTNYYYAYSNEPHTDFPLLDRYYDDATDQAMRDITPRQPFLNPANGVALATSPIFNPEQYLIRRLVDNRVDTLDTIEVLQADIRQRWQTKRGFPGQEHIVDYVTLDLSGSFFPNSNRDNFGKPFAFLEYDATWNVGDRTSIVSSGLYDPFTDGARVFTIGGYLNRPDRTFFFVGYRQIDPIDSRAVTGSATYVFSQKYAITASSVYDFGINQALANSLIITRVGSDLTVSVGVTYNALVNNFGFTLEILPNSVAMTRKSGQGLLGRGLLR
ncbi:MAG: LPS assembly protein LptD [Gemmataceae bacterium]